MNRLPERYLSLSGLLPGLLAAIGLILLMSYSGSRGEQIYQSRLMQIADPAQYHGQTVCLSFIKIEAVRNSEIIGKDRRDHRFKLQTDTTHKMVAGATYSITGQIMSSGHIFVEDMQVHSHRTFKYLFSGLSLAVVIFLTLKYIRINRHGLYVINPVRNSNNTGY